MKTDLINAMRLMKDYCNDTRCIYCEIKKECPVGQEYPEPANWNLEEREEPKCNY